VTPILSGHSHPRNLCILPRRISYALVEQVQDKELKAIGIDPFSSYPAPGEKEKKDPDVVTRIA